VLFFSFFLLPISFSFSFFYHHLFLTAGGKHKQVQTFWVDANLIWVAPRVPRYGADLPARIAALLVEASICQYEMIQKK
jgi:hypothetical protein